jgi:hypothetical protein
MTKLGKLWRKIRQEDRRKMEKTDREIQRLMREKQRKAWEYRARDACMSKKTKKEQLLLFPLFLGMQYTYVLMLTGV